MRAFAARLGVLAQLRAYLWFEWLRSMAPMLVTSSAFFALLRGQADVWALGLGVVCSSTFHYGMHFVSGLIIVPGQAKRTISVLRALSGFTLLDRLNPNLRRVLGSAAADLDAGERKRAASGRSVLDAHGGLNVRIAVPAGGPEVDTAVFGGVFAPRPSGAFLAALSHAGLEHVSGGLPVATTSEVDDDTASLLRTSAGSSAASTSALFRDGLSVRTVHGEAAMATAAGSAVSGRGSSSAAGIATATSTSTAATATARRAPLCIVYLGGNAECWEYSRELWRFAARRAIVVTPNYPGVGDSAGHATRSGMMLAGAAAVDFALHHLGFEERRIVLFGHSIGGGVACEVARSFPAAHLIVDRSFGRLADVVGITVGRMFGSRDASSTAEAAGALVRDGRAIGAAPPAASSSSGGGLRMPGRAPPPTLGDSSAGGSADGEDDSDDAHARTGAGSGQWATASPPETSSSRRSSTPRLAGASPRSSEAIESRTSPGTTTSSGMWATCWRSTFSVSRIAEWLSVFLAGWQMDGAFHLRCQLLYDRSIRDRVMGEASASPVSLGSIRGSTLRSPGSLASSRADAALAAVRAIPGIGRRLVIVSATDRVIPTSVALPTTLADQGIILPPEQLLQLSDIAGDSHNREFTDAEWARIASFLSECEIHP